MQQKPKIQYNYRQNLQLQVVHFQSLMCFLKSLIPPRFLHLLGTIFRVRLRLEQRACVRYLEVILSGDFNNCLFWRSYEVFSKSLMIGGFKLVID